MTFCVPFTKSAARRAAATFSDECLDTSSEKLGVVDEGLYLSIASSVASKPTLEAQESAKRLRDVRMLMADNKIDYYIVPSADEHDSEYVNPLDKRREYISGFTGSAGIALIPSGSPSLSSDKAQIMVDSRYWIQAAQQVRLDDWEVIRSSGRDFDALLEFSTGPIEEHSRVGIDPKYITAIQATKLQGALARRSCILVPVGRNLVDAIHTPPTLPVPIVELHPLRYSGKSTSDKLRDARKALFKGDNDNDVYILPVLPSIAWLLNIRCPGDIPDVPVVKSYVCLTVTSCAFFVDEKKVPREVSDALAADGVETKPYGVAEVIAFAKMVLLGEGLGATGKSVGKVYVPAELSWALSTELQGIVSTATLLTTIACPIDIAKAIKNPVELAGFRAAYLRDGVATVRWMAWMWETIVKNGEKVREWDAGDKLMQFRSQEAEYRGPSYDPISGSGPNGALPHYAPTKGSDRVIDTCTTYVNDSGAQYRDGTIDTTRTMHFGKPTAFQKRAFTRVIQGHLTVAATPFPKGTDGAQLGALGVQYLALDGLRCSHGIGHGVGSYLSVHEGPQGFGGPVALQPGHVLTDEPGVYIEGHWGIRHESAYAVQPVKTRYNMFGEFYGFERFTQVPIQVNLLDLGIMSAEQIKWVREHNQSVVSKVMPKLTGKGDKKAREWLKKVNDGL